MDSQLFLTIAFHPTVMIEKTFSGNVQTTKSSLWLLQLGKAFWIISLSIYFAYLCWTSQRVLVFLEVGILFMALAYLKPYRTRVMPPELCLDLFGVVFAFGLLFQIYNLTVEAPSIAFLLSIDDINRFHNWVLQWPTGLTIFCFYISADFIAYWGHRLLHSRWFWASHAFHHSAKHLNLLSGMRASFVHIVIAYFPYTLMWVFFPFPQAGVIATSLLVFEMVNQHYTHMNIRVPFQKQLEWVFVTPRVHIVHHCAARQYNDSNFGFLITTWDRLFGTYTDPETVDRDEPLGLNYEISTWRLLLGLPTPKKAAVKLD